MTNDHYITKAFQATANLLLRIAKAVGLSYNEVNIIVYYMLIPLVWCGMIDFIIGFPLFSFVWVAVCAFAIYKQRKRFKEWCDYLFFKSVDFLLWFKKWGWSYKKASVIICLIIPLIVTLVLLALMVVNRS